MFRAVIQESREAVSGEKLHVPDLRQTTNYTCGPVSAKAILDYFGKSSLGEKEHARRMGATPEDGIPPGKIAEYLRRFGLKATLNDNLTIDDVKQAVDQGFPVILDIQAWTNRKSKSPQSYANHHNDGHYVIAIGYNKSSFILMDPSIGKARGSISFDELYPRWHDTDADDRRRYHRTGITVQSAHPPVRHANVKRVKHTD